MALILALTAINPAAAQPNPKRKGVPKGAGNGGVTAPSHVFMRGAVEIVTFETEEDYDRLQELFKSTQDKEPEPERTTPLYLRSSTDGSVQPYAVRLPKGFSKEQKYPLVIQLHGLNFNEVLSGSRTRYQGMGGPQWIEADLPIIYAQCFGRPSTFYRGMGEVDVLEVIDEVKRRFPVNADRVYLMGHSMGGSGSYETGLHYPDLFGGIMPLDAAMGMQVAQMRPSQPPPDWMKPQVTIHTAENLFANARNVDVFFKNAGAGIQGKSTAYTDGIVEQGGFSTAESFPRMPHNFGDQYPYSHFVTELIQHPIQRKPAQVKLFTNTLRYNHAYWVTIDRLTRHNADATVEASLDDNQFIRVSTTNIDALTLRMDDSPAAKSGPLVVDGTAIPPTLANGVVHLYKTGQAWSVGEWKSEGLAKRHGLQGPMDDAFNTSFMAVYGEGDRDLAIAELDAVRNPAGVLDIHGDFPMKAAAKVTPADVASKSLILFGTPETNPVLKRIAPSLPAPLMQDEDGARSVFIYPNPENPERYVIVWQGKFLSTPGDMVRQAWIMPLCLLPDYVRVKDGKIVSGGHFDSDWKLTRN